MDGQYIAGEDTKHKVLSNMQTVTLLCALKSTFCEAANSHSLVQVQFLLVVVATLFLSFTKHVWKAQRSITVSGRKGRNMLVDEDKVTMPL